MCHRHPEPSWQPRNTVKQAGFCSLTLKILKIATLYVKVPHIYICGLQNCTFGAQSSATPATVAATPPCGATPFQTQISVLHLPAQGGGRCDTKIFRECSATPVLHLQNARQTRKSAATRVARHV